MKNNNSTINQFNVFLTGCSFLDPNTWGFLDDIENQNTKITHFSGGGNLAIVHNLIQEISINHHEYDFVFVSFSGFDRDDFLIDAECEKPFDYTCHTRDILGNMWNHSGGFGGSYTFEDKGIFKSRYKFGFGDLTQRQINFNVILAAQMILEKFSIPYIFCFYSNQLEVENFSNNQTFGGLDKREHVKFENYEKYLPVSNIINWEKFWFYENGFSKYNGLEEYAFDTDELGHDGFHPTLTNNSNFWHKELMPLYNKLYKDLT